MNTSLTILVVDDDPLIHDMIGEALIDGGFTVARASTPEGAREMIDAPDASYRALVTDINLAPGRPTGWDLAKLLADQLRTSRRLHDWRQRRPLGFVWGAKQRVTLEAVRPIASDDGCRTAAQCRNNRWELMMISYHLVEVATDRPCRSSPEKCGLPQDFRPTRLILCLPKSRKVGPRTDHSTSLA